MNQDDFAALYQAAAGALRLYVLRVCGDAQLADDLVQEAFLRFLGARRPPAAVEDRVRYLYRIASNVMKDHWRRAQRAAARDAIATAPAPLADPANVAGLDLRAALHRLRPRERQLLWLAYADGYSHLEMAEILGHRPASIRVLLFRARRRMLRELEAAKAP